MTHFYSPLVLRHFEDGLLVEVLDCDRLLVLTDEFFSEGGGRDVVVWSIINCCAVLAYRAQEQVDTCWLSVGFNARCHRSTGRVQK